MQSVGPGNRHHCRDRGGIQGSARSRSSCRRETSDAAGNCRQRRNDDCQHKRLFKTTGLANQANGKGEKSRSMNGAAALHCHQRRRTECRRRTALHHSYEKSWAGECCLFYCSAFSLFLVRNHHSITESGLIFTRFSIYLSSSKKTITQHWKRGSGRKKSLNCIWVGALTLSISAFLFDFCLTTCTRESTTEWMVVVGIVRLFLICFFSDMRLSSQAILHRPEMRWRNGAVQAREGWKATYMYRFV